MPVMNSPMLVNTREMGEETVAIMANNPVVMLKAHGVARPARKFWNVFPMPLTWRKMRGGNIWRCRSATRMSSATKSRRPAGKSLRTPSLFRKTWDHYRSKIS